MENNDKLKEFIYKHQKNKKDISKQISFANDNIALVPWYRRPLDKNEFSTHCSNNGNWYIRHKEWSKHIFIGPYKTLNNCNDIINSYVMCSLQGNSLDKKISSDIHSVTITNPNDFFKNC